VVPGSETESDKECDSVLPVIKPLRKRKSKCRRALMYSESSGDDVNDNVTGMSPVLTYTRKTVYKATACQTDTQTPCKKVSTDVGTQTESVDSVATVIGCVSKEFNNTSCQTGDVHVPKMYAPITIPAPLLVNTVPATRSPPHTEAASRDTDAWSDVSDDSDLLSAYDMYVQKMERVENDIVLDDAYLNVSNEVEVVSEGAGRVGVVTGHSTGPVKQSNQQVVAGVQRTGSNPILREMLSKSRAEALTRRRHATALRREAVYTSLHGGGVIETAQTAIIRAAVHTPQVQTRVVTAVTNGERPIHATPLGDTRTVDITTQEQVDDARILKYVDGVLRWVADDDEPKPTTSSHKNVSLHTL
jgi:hypothetical protein